MDSSLTFSSICWALFAIFVALYIVYEFSRRRNVPPGPFSLPLLGSVGFYKEMSGVPPHIGLAKAAKKYGPVFSVWVGPSLIIILDGYEAIHQAFVGQGANYIDRPNWITAVKEVVREGNGVAWSNREEWHVLRKFCIKSIREFGLKTGETEQKIIEEIEMIQHTMRKTNSELTGISHVLQMAVSNVIGSIVFGQRFGYDDENLHTLLKGLDLMVKGSGFVSPLNFLPKFFHPLFPKENKVKLERETAVARTKILVSDIFERHASTFEAENIRDLMDVYIQSTKEDMTKSRNKYFHKGNMWRVIYDLFLAGSETTSNSLEWAFLRMIERPDIQRKCQQAIAECVGDRPVQMSDRPKLTYIDAVLNEVLRLASVIPMGVPRTNVTNDTFLMGHRIPKYAIVLPNIYSAHMDPNYWPDPFEFKPERFLDSDNKLVHKESFLPFSLGQRNCLGDTLSRMETFLIFTNMLQKFNFFRDEDAQKHDFSMDQEQFMSLKPRHYRLKAISRVQ